MDLGSEGHDNYTHLNCYFQVDSIFLSHVVGIMVYPAEGHVGHKDEMRDSRAQPCGLFIPDGSGDTLTSRINTRYGHLSNGHEASVVKIKSFISYFDSGRYVINHHNGDVYLWDRESNNLELLALLAGTMSLSVDAMKMLAQTATNAC